MEVLQLVDFVTGKEVLGYCMGMGFKGVLKPDSWAAMEVSDRFSK